MSTRRLIAAAGTLLLAACADQERTLTGPPLAASRNVTSESSSDVWQSIVTGETGPGSQYALYMPRNWDASGRAVVYYGHGIRDVTDPIELRDQNQSFDVRDALGALGYAVAYSSFDDNGYAEKDGAQRTHQLRGLFSSRFGDAGRSILAGHSLGGLIALDLSQRFPGQYDGAVSFCGVVGGSQAEIDYVANTRLLFDMFYPTGTDGQPLLRGAYDDIPAGYSIDAVTRARITDAVLPPPFGHGNPTGLLAIASVKEVGLEFNPFGSQQQVLTQLVTSLITALSYHARGADNLLTFTNGKFPFNNADPRTEYSASAIPLLPSTALSGVLAQINANAPRTTGDHTALRYMEKYFTPSGELAVPTLTLHNRFDPLVPYFHEPVLAGRVAAAGATNLLVQRTDPRYGHCLFDVEQMVKAITDVNEWARSGVKPAS